ncbi:MAG: hypothetical protein PHS74_07470 [Lachnospiraceae bacterium]|nr:hypothetical protein [Lachnospiraceae bacterium]
MNKKMNKRSMKIGRKVMGFCSAIICSALLFQTTVCAAEAPGVNSLVYVSMNAADGTIIADRNADIPIYPASTTKLVTAMVICDVLPMDSVIVVTQEQLNHVTPGVTKAGLQAGGEYFAYELLSMLLVSSSADAAQVLAEVTYGNTQNFVQKMNEKVQQMGLTSTHFDNIIGLDIGDGYVGTYSTAREIAIITQNAMKNGWIRTIVGLPSYAIAPRTNNGAIVKNNTNAFLIGTMPYSTNLYTIIGSKTGTTKAAGYVLAATATNGSKEIICVSAYNPDSATLYTAEKQLFDYSYSQK